MSVKFNNLSASSPTTARELLALGDDLYTLALIDKDSEVLHWLLVDIPVGELSDAGNKGITVSYWRTIVKFYEAATIT